MQTKKNTNLPPAPPTPDEIKIWHVSFLDNQGYWEKPSLTKEIFEAIVEGEPETFLR